MRTKEIIERKLKNFGENDIPKIISNEKMQSFVQEAVFAIYATNSCYVSNIARNMNHDTKLKSREKLALSRLENLNTFELNELLFKDAIRHLYSNKFYIAMDETPIKKHLPILIKMKLIHQYKD